MVEKNQAVPGKLLSAGHCRGEGAMMIIRQYPENCDSPGTAIEETGSGAFPSPRGSPFLAKTFTLVLDKAIVMPIGCDRD